MKFVGAMVIFLATASFAAAGLNGVPEIDASTGGSALALISGAVLVLRSRKK